MRRKSALIIVLALCIGLMGGCSNKVEKAESAALHTATDSSSGLRLSQSQAVTSTTYMNSSDFADFITVAEPAFIIPGLNEAMIPQGMGYCSGTGLIYISGYYSSDAPSVIVAVDADSYEFVAEYFLYNSDGSPFTSHVGGLAVTEDSLYISAKLDNDGSYSIAVLPLSDLPTSGSNNLRLTKTISVPVSPSFMSCSGGYIWIGNFYYPKADYELSTGINFTTATADGDYGCYILGYPLDSDFSSPDVILVAPDRIQGFTLLSDGTAVLSQSYGRKNNSTLYSYGLDLTEAQDTFIALGDVRYPAYILDSSRLVSFMTVMPMTEALSTDQNGSLLVLFESGAMHYSDGKFRTDSVWKIQY